jgi:uncharacterized membrane protein YbhN (UPF0104 family)
VQRFTWATAIKTALIGLIAFAVIGALSGVDLQSLVDELQGADWGWVFFAFILSPAIQLFQSFSTLGACVRSLRFAAVVMLQYAIQFIALVIPSSAARVALEIRFFQSFGIEAGGATSIGIVDSLGGFAVQVALLLLITVTGLANLDLFGSVTGSDSSASSSSSTDSSSSGHLLGLAVGLIIVGVLAALVLPRLRARIKRLLLRLRVLLSDQRSSVAEALTVLRHPGKLFLMFGGNLSAQLLQAVILGVCLKAFGYSATFAELILINTAVSLFAGFMPVPGGMGVAEAGYTAGLEAIGVPGAVAMSTAITYRLVTFYLPPIWGAPAMRWLRHRSYV